MTHRPITDRRDAYHIALAALLGAQFKPSVALSGWVHYDRPGGAYFGPVAEASRKWLHDNNHDLEGWCEHASKD